MAYRFADELELDQPTGAPLAKGPVGPGEMLWIGVWVYQDSRRAAGRGSKDWGNSPLPPGSTWECATDLFQASNQKSDRFVPGPALGMAVALVREDNKKKYYGWWDDTEIVP
jgi:hypothetical protein